MTALFGPERKPWEDPADERLAPSSYAASAVFGLTELAIETLHEHGYELTPTRVGAYAQMFSRIVIKVQIELGSGGGWNSSLNTRLRGALRTAIKVASTYDPTDQDTERESWEAWEAELERLVVSIARTAAWLYTRTPKQLGAVE